MKTLLLIFLGGGSGSVFRYLLSQFISSYWVGKFPLGTFLCNILGCVLIGLFNALAARLGWSADTRLMLTVGLCGGFTTFSTFTNEGLSLLQAGHYGIYALYLLLSIAAGLLVLFLTIRSI